MTLEEHKAQARAAFKAAREAYLSAPTSENWRVFCDAKRQCRLVGVIV